MDFSRIKKPLRGKVVLEAIEESEEDSLIITPIEYRERYPQVGKVRLVGEGSTLPLGVFAVLPNEGDTFDGPFWTVAFVLLSERGEDLKLLFSAEVFDIVRETVEADRRSGTPRWITLKTIDGETIRFTSDEVLTYGLEDLSEPGVRLDYLPVSMLRAWEDGIEKLFYILSEDQILFTFEEPL